MPVALPVIRMPEPIVVQAPVAAPAQPVMTLAQAAPIAKAEVEQQLSAPADDLSDLNING